MEALVTRVGERSSPYLLELYDVNCPFCARVALNTWRDLLSSGAYFELVYLPVHYAIWKDYSLRTAEGTYTANLSAFCIDDPVKRVEYVLRLFEVTASIRKEPEAIEKQLELARGEFGDLKACLKRKVGPLVDDPELAYELAHEYVLSLGVAASGVPTAAIIDGGKAVEMGDGLDEVERLIKKYLEDRRRGRA